MVDLKLNKFGTCLIAFFIFVLVTTSCEQRDPLAEYDNLCEAVYSNPQEGIDAAQEYIDYFYNKDGARIDEVSEIRQQYRMIQDFRSNSYNSLPDFLSQVREINQELSYSNYNGVRKMWTALYEKERDRLLEPILESITEYTFDDFFKAQVRRLCENEFNLWDVESIDQVSLATPTLDNNRTAKKSYGEYRIHLRGKLLGTAESARISIEGTIGINDYGYINETRTGYQFLEKPLLK